MRKDALRNGVLAVAGLGVLMTSSAIAGSSVLTTDTSPPPNPPFADSGFERSRFTGQRHAENDRPPETKSDRDVDPAVQNGADASDPEPDAVVIPKTPGPSHDPLDRAKPAASDHPPTDPTKSTDATETPLAPLNAAIKAALDKRESDQAKAPKTTEKAKEREAVASYYAGHGFSPLWSDAGKPADTISSVVARLAAAKDDGLSLPASPAGVTTTGSPQDIAESDIAFTEAVVAYARQATGARIEPHSISPLVGLKPDLADPEQVLDSLKSAGAEAGDKLHELNPSDPRYIALREKLAEMRKDSAPKEGTQAIEPGALVKVGMRDPRVPLIRARLGLQAKADGDDTATVYDAALAAEVLKFQRIHGLMASGVIGDPTISAFNGGNISMPPARLETTIIANMEMWRWLPRDLGADRVEVNIPDYAVKVYHDGKVIATNRVVVGKSDTPTPIFSNAMKYLVVNPAWNVPQSIIKKEFGGGAPHGFTARYVNGQLFVQQPPGPGNALGRITFMFPNDYAVYLHDTPAKGLFGTPRRAYSHGCVRVDKPFELAQSILNDRLPDDGKPQWSVRRLETMLGTTERRIDLPSPLPIYIMYFNASVDGSDKLATREDVYGYAGAVARALGLNAAGSAPVAGWQPSGPAFVRHSAAATPFAGRSRKHRYADFDAGDRPTRHSRRRKHRYADDDAPQPVAHAAQTTPRSSYSQGFGYVAD